MGAPVETWVVQLEAESTERTGPIDAGSVAHVLVALSAQPIGLWAPGRCAVQLRIAASSPAVALEAAFSRWLDAFWALERPAWPIVRAEVLTPDELEREFEDDELQATLGTVCVRETEDDAAGALIRRAFSDAATNLPNEEAFHARVHAALARSRRLGTTPAVICGPPTRWLASATPSSPSSPTAARGTAGSAWPSVSWTPSPPARSRTPAPSARRPRPASR